MRLGVVLVQGDAAIRGALVFAHQSIPLWLKRRLLTGVVESHNTNLPCSPGPRVPECVDA